MNTTRVYYTDRTAIYYTEATEYTYPLWTERNRPFYGADGFEEWVAWYRMEDYDAMPDEPYEWEDGWVIRYKGDRATLADVEYCPKNWV